MNLFNCFQAVGFYTLLPFLMMYLNDKGYTVWSSVVFVIMMIGYVFLSFAVYTYSDKR